MATQGRKSPLGSHGWISSLERRETPKADSALAEKQQPIYAGAASTTLTSDPVGTTFVSRKSALRNSVPYSSPVRS